MPSKMVIDRTRNSQPVEQLAEVFAPQAAAKLVAWLGDGMPMDDPPDFTPLVRFLGKALKRSRERMVEADQAHDAALRAGSLHRDRRDRAAGVLRVLLRDSRILVNHLYGRDLATDSQAGCAELLRDAERLLRTLRRPDDGVAEAARRYGIGFDPAAFADGLEAPRRELSQAISAAKEAEVQAIYTRSVKVRAIAAHDARYREVSRLLELLLRLAGSPLVADRVRPHRRKARRPRPAAGPPRPAPRRPETAVPPEA